MALLVGTTYCENHKVSLIILERKLGEKVASAKAPAC